MVKLLGSALVLGGGALAWWTQRRSRRETRDTLSDLIRALRRMQEEIRMARTPLPSLLESLAADNRAGALFLHAAEAARQGGDLAAVWRREALALPLNQRDRETVAALDLRGDEESVCKAISLATYDLAKSAGELEARRPEEEKRATALCFSAAALLVILLI
jgi:stage III sporulation protein AB